MLGIKDIVRCPYCNKLYEHDFGRILSYEYNGRTVVHDVGHLYVKLLDIWMLENVKKLT